MLLHIILQFATFICTVCNSTAVLAGLRLWGRASILAHSIVLLTGKARGVAYDPFFVMRNAFPKAAIGGISVAHRTSTVHIQYSWNYGKLAGGQILVGIRSASLRARAGRTEATSVLPNHSYGGGRGAKAVSLKGLADIQPTNVCPCVVAGS